MSTEEVWTFGVEPLPQALVLAPLLRRVVGLVQALEQDDPSVAVLLDDLRRAEQALAACVPPDPAPRIGDGPENGRAYVDHARDIGAFNPCFPEYEITVAGPKATGTVTFPPAFEGPPGIVHGGVVATFFDCVIQHHNCDVGVAGKTTSLEVRFRRPAPLGMALGFEIDRVGDDRRTSYRARLYLGAETLCTATVEAVAGDRSTLPAVSPRRER